MFKKIYTLYFASAMNNKHSSKKHILEGSVKYIFSNFQTLLIPVF